MTVTIRPITPADKAAWDLLYQGYAAFYGVEQTPQMRETVWGWLHDHTHEVNGFVAEAGGKLIGLTHYRPFASPLAANMRGFLDDLYVDPGARGSGAAQALIDAVSEVGREKGWALIRWITADDNYRARSLYDRTATRTQWITYDKKL
ncbi:GNAT family N-acetyltransferase [Sulfitobacter donghicola]|uniref:Acetyltransferase n=1 Tax=Sulfitobacter donghicola DSW-25 = KCTC 12864 = JCM 14565 TaxID=1300350 RepID=A0A073IFC3_9RHOB|nr:GNAT family N-acetyltransferase [Sulfitobacter donghicola]KEJ88201.1 acetyltransferase [Sulfitobacter donghicola DSW-25 = KCTC 12864 = JCM 14565]KIN68793.1 Acetyltransferase [Sulfitobacter donghicola DSW-25 = KCTC 12864 = JCM 14565]